MWKGNLPLPYVTDVHNSPYSGLWLHDRGLVPGTDKAPTVPLLFQEFQASSTLEVSSHGPLPNRK